MPEHHMLAFDLGAESGRAILGSLKGDGLELTELHRFRNSPVEIRGHLHWDVIHLFRGITEGLRACVSETHAEPVGLGVDTWGVDFGLLASNGDLLGLPYAYRDSRTDGAMEAVFDRVPRDEVYRLTGVQFMPINTLFQLYSMVRDRSPLLEIADALLFTPDLYTYLLSGVKKTEFTIASTSQLYSPVADGWASEIFDALDIPLDIMQDVVQPGTVVGMLESKIGRATGVGEVPVIATASHDTAAAVAATPAEGRDWAYISSGTWSLMGVENEEPIITRASLSGNFTNEGGVGGTFRVLKNISGLWLLQQCRKAWAAEREYGYDELAEIARSSAPFQTVIEPDHPSFLSPPDMPDAIVQFCRQTGQRPPETPAEFARCILEGLALKYRMVLDQLGEMYEHPISRIHIIGGGCRNELLCQFTAEATGLPVLAGPVEATAAGNVLVQALALGHIGSLAEMRHIVSNSFPTRVYEPSEREGWDLAYERFREMHARVIEPQEGL